MFKDSFEKSVQKALDDWKKKTQHKKNQEKNYLSAWYLRITWFPLLKDT